MDDTSLAKASRSTNHQIEVEITALITKPGEDEMNLSLVRRTEYLFLNERRKKFKIELKICSRTGLTYRF